jgi:hypothetical protein
VFPPVAAVPRWVIQHESPRQETTRRQREVRQGESRKAAFRLRIAALVSLPRTV